MTNQKTTATYRGFKGKLLRCSRNAFILSLESLNRIDSNYRTQIFSLILVNAWELLLKAKVIGDASDSEAVFVKKNGRTDRKRTISITKSINKVFSKTHDPVRANLERVVSIRDQSAHIILDPLPPEVMLLFQSCVINYRDCLYDWFGINVMEGVSPGMVSIVVDFGKTRIDFSNSSVRKKYGITAADYFLKLQKQIDEDSALYNDDRRYIIGVEHKLVLTKNNKNKADIVLNVDSGAGKSAVKIEVPKDSGKTHPYTTSEAIKEIAKRVKYGHKFTEYDMPAIDYTHGIKKKARLHYQSTIKNSPHQYSQDFINWVVTRYESDKSFFSNSRERYLEYRRSKRRQAKS